MQVTGLLIKPFLLPCNVSHDTIGHQATIGTEMLTPAQRRRAVTYRNKCIVHAVQINPQTEPLAASRLVALKKAGQAAEFFKSALRDYQMAERRDE